MESRQELENAAELAEPCETMAEYYAQRQAAVRAFVATFGPMTPEQEGAFAVLAEFIYTGTIVGNDYPGYGWIPLATMTDDEIKTKAAQADAEHEADNSAIEAARKVVSIADRMPVR
jgi:hypothetical protein